MKRVYKKISSVLAILFLLGIFTLSGYIQNAYATTSLLEGGDFFQAFNNTTQEGTWRDPVYATPGQVIEYRIVLNNTSDQTVYGIQVIPQLPQKPSDVEVTSATIWAQNYGFGQMTDTATVYVTGGSKPGMSYYPGHARLLGVTSLFNCPNTCNISDDLVYKGLTIGDLAAGQKVEIGFKVAVNPVATESPSPTATPSPSPSASPSVSPSVSPSSTPSSPAPTVVNQVPPPTSTLPKTGIPLAGLALTGLLPAGVGIRRFGKKTVETLSANSLWENREMKK